MNDTAEKTIILTPTAGSAYGLGWRRLKKSFLDLFLIIVIVAAVYVPLGMIESLDGRETPGGVLLKMFSFAYLVLLLMPLDTGASWVFLKGVRGEKIDVQDMFSVFENYVNVALAGLLAGEVTVRGVGMPSMQGDSQIVGILKSMGGDVSPSEGGIGSSRSRLKGIELDARHVPDLVPIVAAAASRAEGDTVIRGVKRLRYKESDRVSALADSIGRMGGNIRAEEDAIVVSGRGITKGAEIDTQNDHRIAMACAVLALASEGETVINDAECVSKSYPSFFYDLRSMGADVEVFL